MNPPWLASALHYCAPRCEAEQVAWANYKEAQHLGLDLNQPATQRDLYRERAEKFLGEYFALRTTPWCTSHRRYMTHYDQKGRVRCNPALGGIMLPCSRGL